MKRGPKRKPIEFRFWEKVNKTETCWIWTGSISSTGYGNIVVRSGKVVNAHRFSYELHKGKIPDGLVIDHKCRVRKCVNPDHMEAVSNAENMRRGNGSKLSEEQVTEIRKLRSAGETLESIARRFGVDNSNIHRIVSGVIWKGLSGQVFCFSCEGQIEDERGLVGPFCLPCFRKTRRRDPLMRAALQRRLVALVPSICPHEEGCKYDRMPPRYFNIIVFDEKLEPIKVEGPYLKRIAEQEAKHIQEKIDRRRKRGSK